MAEAVVGHALRSAASYEGAAAASNRPAADASRRGSTARLAVSAELRLTAAISSKRRGLGEGRAAKPFIANSGWISH
jgi:hypothetical protein